MKQALVSCDVPADWAVGFSQCLYEWQGLEAGGFAILAAFIGYLAIRKQIKHSKESEDRRLLRVFRARRSTLPLILSNTIQYAEEVIRTLAIARTILVGPGNIRLTGQWSPPVFPEDIPAELRDFLEISDHEPANALISELLRQLQTLRSRLLSLVTEEDIYRIGISHNLVEYQLQASKIRQLCGALFPFGRGETGEVPSELRRDEVVNSINFIDHHAEDDLAFAGRVEAFLQANEIWWPQVQ